MRQFEKQTIKYISQLFDQRQNKRPRNHTTQTNNRIYKNKKKQTLERKLLTNKNKLLGNDFENEELQSQNQKQPQYKNSKI